MENDNMAISKMPLVSYLLAPGLRYDHVVILHGLNLSTWLLYNKTIKAHSFRYSVEESKVFFVSVYLPQD